MTPRHRFRRWRYRRAFARMGWPPDPARYMGSIAASLNVPPKVLGAPPGLNHWSAWAPQPIPPATHCPTWQGWEPHAVWLDEAPLLERPPSETPADGG